MAFRAAQAAAQAEARHQLLLASHYWSLEGYNSNGMLRDKAQAARLFRQAADQGLAEAQFNLGYCTATWGGRGRAA
jgi:TPR repeat protein